MKAHIHDTCGGRMTTRTTVRFAAVFLVAAACARPTIAPVTTSAVLQEINAPCNAANATLEAPARAIDFAPLAFSVPSRWIPDYGSINNVNFNLQRTESELQVWKGSEFVFAPVLPTNTVQCDIVKGDTTITIRTTALVVGIRRYRVDVTWSPLIDGQHLYMQLHTRFPDHLRQIRGVIESVRAGQQRAAVRQ